MDKDTRKFIKELRKQGFEVDESGKHPKVYSEGQWIATLSGTASDWRSRRNAEAVLKRHGYQPKR